MAVVEKLRGWVITDPLPPYVWAVFVVSRLFLTSEAKLTVEVISLPSCRGLARLLRRNDTVYRSLN